ncbi:hypothetical protein [Candidatus Kuenenia sp.]|uniref:hypothetical protein n=1 Tax=Candidatus Kuenenia sp. TaxID=2499824 RepID=UPI0032203453
MDSGINDNLEEGEKHKRTLFSSLYNFWAIIGAVFLAMVIVLFVFNYSLLKQHATIHHDLENMSSMLERYALSKITYNSKWIRAKEAETDKYNDEIEKCRALIYRMDSQLETFFLNNIPGKGIVKIEDEALWRHEYLKRVSQLFAKLEESAIGFNGSALPFHDWGATIPTWDEILPEQKRFWILEALVNALLKNTGVINLEKISFKTAPNNKDDTYLPLYSTIPLTISLALEAERLPFLLNELLTASIPFVIENINIESTGKKTVGINYRKSDGSTIENQDTFTAVPTISILIDAYVIDFKT